MFYCREHLLGWRGACCSGQGQPLGEGQQGRVDFAGPWGVRAVGDQIFVSPPSSHVEALSPNAAVSGEKASAEVIMAR